MRKLLVLIAAVLLTAGTAIAGTTDITTNTAEYNGYCPVAYQEMGKAVKGLPEFSSTYEGNTYWFANADAKKMFDANQSKYVVQFDGNCAWGIANGQKVAGNPQYFWTNNGKTYFFSTETAKTDFSENTTANLTKANNQWTTILATIKKEMRGMMPVTQ